GVLADLQHLLPGLAAVGRLVEAAVAPRAPQRPLRRHVDDVRVARVHDDLADVLARLEPDVLPRGAAVVGPVDAVAVGDTALAVVLTRADPDDERVLRVEGHAADRVRPLAIEDRAPGGPGVAGLPHAPRGDRHVPGGLVVRHHGDVHDAARSDRRADAAQLEPGE